MLTLLNKVLSKIDQIFQLREFFQEQKIAANVYEKLTDDLKAFLSLSPSQLTTKENSLDRNVKQEYSLLIKSHKEKITRKIEERKYPVFGLFYKDVSLIAFHFYRQLDCIDPLLFFPWYKKKVAKYRAEYFVCLR